MKIYPELMDCIRRGARITRDSFKTTNESTFIFCFVVFLAALVIAITLLFPESVHANQIFVNYDKKAVACVIGEAENQGFMGMLAISHAIRNKGNLEGVRGCTAMRVRLHLYSQQVYNNAKLAWDESAFDYDLTHGATNWNRKTDGECSIFFNEMPKVFEFKDHCFYKKVES